MFLHTIILIYLTLASTQSQGFVTKKDIATAALIDDASSLLEIVNNSLVTAINGAHSRLDGYYDMFETNLQKVQLEAEVIMGHEEKRIYGQIAAIQEAAESSDADISTCLGNYEEEVFNFRTLSNDSVSQCASTEQDQAAEIVEEYKYLVDIRINRVNALEFELALCDPTNEDCISPIYEKIQLENQYGAESIDMQLIKVINLFSDLKVSVQDCSNLNVDQFINNINSVLQAIMECADAIIE